MGPKAVLAGKIFLVCILCVGTIVGVVFVVEWLA